LHVRLGMMQFHSTTRAMRMQTEQDLYTQFQEDVDHIATDLVTSYGLKFAEEVAHLSEPLLRWLDFTTRFIPPAPRSILRSNKFPKALTPETQAALEAIEQLFITGKDVNPYQSKGLILYNDTSTTKRQQRTDLLWADWGIHHLHLTTLPALPGEYFSPRSEWLLFCLVVKNSVGLIDIRNHSEKDIFSDPSLIKIVVQTWPEFMDRFKLKGVLPPTSSNHTAAEIASLRRAGVASFVEIDKQLFIGPGMGVTTASTPTRISQASMKIRRCVHELVKVVIDPSGQFSYDAKASGVANPAYNLVLTPRGLAVYENKSSKAFVLPRRNFSNDQSFLSELHDLLSPKWAVDFIVQKIQDIQIEVAPKNQTSR
jgi:hypothetical protein